MSNSYSRIRSLIFAALLAVPGSGAPAERAPSGIFLVATNEIRDPNFSRAVVLVTQPAQGGPFGVIINRPLPYRLSQALPQYETLKEKRDVLYYGGPVMREGLVFLVRSSRESGHGVRILKDVYLTADREEIDGLLKRPDPTKGLRVYAGHSGWGLGQLQSEIARGGWYIVPADAEAVFAKNPSRIWEELTARARLRKTGNDGIREMKGAVYR